MKIVQESGGKVGSKITIAEAYFISCFLNYNQGLVISIYLILYLDMKDSIAVAR